MTHAHPNLQAAAAVLSDVRAIGGALALDLALTGLRYSGPAGALPQSLAAAIRVNRPGLLALLALAPLDGTEPPEVRRSHWAALDRWLFSLGAPPPTSLEQQPRSVTVDPATGAYMLQFCDDSEAEVYPPVAAVLAARWRQEASA